MTSDGSANPYPGLAPLLEGDVERFHGRRKLLGRLLEALKARRCVVVLGPPGAGKTSLVRAGAVPHRRCEAGQRWRWDGVDFEVLQPTPEGHATALKSNAPEGTTWEPGDLVDFRGRQLSVESVE